jgi:demethylmenaquinone methyltransferase/2-methoxy-6-polyprenyl-1,4-benzoquinol methylase
VAILEFSRPRNLLVRMVNSIYCNRIMPLTATLLARDRSGAYCYLPRSVQTFAQPEALSSMLSKAGFRQPRQSPLTFGICTATVAWR